MKNLFFVLLTSTLLLFGCSKDYVDTDHPVENNVFLSEGDELSLRSGNANNSPTLTQFEFINFEVNQTLSGQFEGLSICNVADLDGRSIKYLVDFDVVISSYKSGEETKVIVHKLIVNGGGVDVDNTPVEPVVLFPYIYDADPNNTVQLDDHHAKPLKDIDPNNPLVYTIGKTFTVTPNHPLIVSLYIGQARTYPMTVCALAPKFVVQTKETFLPMEEMSNALNTAFSSPNDKISAAWIYKSFLGLAYGNKYSMIEMRTGKKVAQGSYSDEAAGGFWQNAPVVNIGGVEHHPTSASNGITAGWIYGDLIGFTAKNAYWHSLLSNFHLDDVWGRYGSGSGDLNKHDFWDKPHIGLPPEAGITAGFKDPFGYHVVFSKDKIFVYSHGGKDGVKDWIIGKRFKDLQPNEPFAFLADLNEPEINAAFYNAGSKEAVFMNGRNWHAYKVFGENSGTWTHGTMDHQ